MWRGVGVVVIRVCSNDLSLVVGNQLRSATALSLDDPALYGAKTRGRNRVVDAADVSGRTPASKNTFGLAAIQALIPAPPGKTWLLDGGRPVRHGQLPAIHDRHPIGNCKLPRR
ncbi:hypothetical protein BURKHO8Y_480071 [Burkholderia sp. 8Y]|nr:hypothetical protein BURKHO8Y_480071 [Burkholderia sp. 8Y]